jgi:hypothetical protein
MNPSPEPAPVLETVDFNADPADTNKPPHRKIAQLPKKLRDLINSLLDDSVPYPRIVERLQQSTDPPLPYPISEMNISRWKTSGYLRYLAQQERLDYLRANREAALDMVASDDTTTLPEATLQIIASQYYDVLGDFSPEPLKQKLADDPIKYTRFVNAFARLTREILILKKHRAESAQAVTKLQRRDPNREFNEVERDGWLDRADDLFNFKSTRRLQQTSSNSSSPPERSEVPIPNRESSSCSSSSFSSSSPSPSEDDCRRQGPRSAPRFPDLGNPSSGGLGKPNESLINETAVVPIAAVQPTPQRNALPTGSAGIPAGEVPESPKACESTHVSAAPAPTETAKSQSKKVQNAEIEMPAQPVPAAPDHSDTNPSIHKSMNPISPDITIHNSQTKMSTTDHEPLHTDSPELCYDCGTPLPALLPNGQRPLPSCHGCGARLFPPGTKFDHCPYCQVLQPILANDERPSTNCRSCGNLLPPVGQRFVTHCPACGFELPPLTTDGTRISDRCPECRAHVPLLEPTA